MTKDRIVVQIRINRNLHDKLKERSEREGFILQDYLGKLVTIGFINQTEEN